MKKVYELIGLALFLFLASVVYMFAAYLSDSKRTAKDDADTVTEEVEMVTYRTSLRHEGCPSNGFMVAYGTPEKITAYGINRCIWPHRCDGCGFTNRIYDAHWPKFRQEWRAVK